MPQFNIAGDPDGQQCWVYPRVPHSELEVYILQLKK